MNNKKLCPPTLDGLIWLWKTSVIIAKNQEKGNTLIIAITLGLIMIAATSLSLLNSSKDKTNAQAGEFTKQAIAVAELGVTRVHNFLAENSTLAEYSSTPDIDKWANLVGTTQPPQGTFTNSFSSNSTCSALTSGASSINDLSTKVGQFRTSGDTVVTNPSTATDFRKGAFKVLKYHLQDTSFTDITPSIDLTQKDITLPLGILEEDIYGYGVLTVESQINPSATSASDLFASNPNASKTRIEVTVPLQKAPNNTPFPGVWIANQEIGSPTNSIIDATLLVPDCNNMGLNIMPGNKVILANLQLPTLPTPPADTDPKYYDLGDITSSITLPRSGDLPIETQITQKNGTNYNMEVYKYKVNDINLSGSAIITIVPGRKVVLNIYGNINMDGSQVIDNSCTSVSGQYTCNDTTKVVTYPSGDPSLFRRENLEIVGYGVNTGGPTSSQPSICLSGGAEIFGFVFAPDYAVGAAGTGGGNGFTGAVWARMFNPPSTCGSNTGQVIVVQDIFDWPEDYSPENMPPKIGTITKWERKEAN